MNIPPKWKFMVYPPKCNQKWKIDIVSDEFKIKTILPQGLIHATPLDRPLSGRVPAMKSANAGLEW